jgi:predicted nuclease with RNAse H fold
MITIGIDMSSQPTNTAACVIEWNESNIHVHAPALRCDDGKLDDLIKEHGFQAVVGIDAPFGWPAPFVEAVANWSFDKWDPKICKVLRFRETDRVVNEITKINPLSVSTDLISLPAMRTMALLHRHSDTGRSDFYEVYPAASLKCWSIPSAGYKKDKDGKKSRDVRDEMIKTLLSQLPLIGSPSMYAETDHAPDALIASLTARAAAKGLTEKSNGYQVDLAKSEGWIHLPFPDCLDRLGD